MGSTKNVGVDDVKHEAYFDTLGELPIDWVVEAAKQVNLSIPLVVRLEGTNVELGKNILAESGLDIIAAEDLADAAKKVVAAIAT